LGIRALGRGPSARQLGGGKRELKPGKGVKGRAKEKNVLLTTCQHLIRSTIGQIQEKRTCGGKEEGYKNKKAKCYEGPPKKKKRAKIRPIRGGKDPQSKAKGREV